jgi:hypothetical protein
MWADADDEKKIFAAVDRFLEGDPDCALVGSEVGSGRRRCWVIKGQRIR